MVWWIACLVIACDLCLALLFVSLRLQINLQGRAEPTGAWALAGGVRVGPLAASGAGAQGAPATLQLHAWGRRLWHRPARSLLAGEEQKDQPKTEQAKRALRSLSEGYRSFDRWFDPLDVAVFLVGERRRIRARQLEVDLDYSFDDIVLTGRVLAAIYVLRSVMPAQVVLREKHSWESIDRIQAAISGEIELWPVLAALDVLFYVVRKVKIRPRRKAARGATEST